MKMPHLFPKCQDFLGLQNKKNKAKDIFKHIFYVVKYCEILVGSILLWCWFQLLEFKVSHQGMLGEHSYHLL